MGSRYYEITRTFIFECLNIYIDEHNWNLICFVIIPNKTAAKKKKVNLATEN